MRPDARAPRFSRAPPGGKLYAPGTNGNINFISNVTLDSESSVIIAANAVTINNGVVVTITGDDGVNASVFTNVPNYTGSGGNGSTNGTVCWERRNNRTARSGAALRRRV